MSTLAPDTVRRIEDAAAALIAAGTPNPTNEQVRQHLGGGSLSHISPVMRDFRARQRALASEQTPALPAELTQLLTGQLGLLWQAAVRQADADTLAAREQADADTEQADRERDEALAKVATLESELAVLREVQAERDRLLKQELGLNERMISLREEVVRQQTRNEHLTAQLEESRQDLKTLRDSEKTLQQELLTLARADSKVKK
ncbi:DNA-binding protein [Pluralibacter sp.]|uniref:DNA-binding protein n=1 Tax=Pluralibacter sp. TaxID=1920032 RepID=UPI0025E3AF7F|nr:DNA-binding protein [Pluralibacter sp.]MBV8042572.1 DNA-binding protein [Pluralibacter sp.]